jgi:hypothetical protein
MWNKFKINGNETKQAVWGVGSSMLKLRERLKLMVVKLKVKAQGLWWLNVVKFQTNKANSRIERT